jgi:hypothetical protein
MCSITESFQAQVRDLMRGYDSTSSKAILLFNRPLSFGLRHLFFKKAGQDPVVALSLPIEKF